MDRVRVRFSGRVQGVGFRATSRSVARAFPVTGWVRNEPDGTVLLEAQGDAAALQSFLAALRSRLGAFIQSETTEPVQPRAGEHAFEVRH